MNRPTSDGRGWVGLRVERQADGRMLVLGPVLVTPGHEVVEACSLEELAFELQARHLEPVQLSDDLLRFPDYAPMPTSFLDEVRVLMVLEPSFGRLEETSQSGNKQ